MKQEEILFLIREIITDAAQIRGISPEISVEDALLTAVTRKLQESEESDNE